MEWLTQTFNYNVNNTFNMSEGPSAVLCYSACRLSVRPTWSCPLINLKLFHLG